MTDESLAQFLNEINASSDTVQQGFRYYLAEMSDDLPPSDMESELLTAAKDQSELRSELEALERSADGIEEIAPWYLTVVWDDPAQREAIKAALRGANVKLPVIEAALMAIVAMYGMYLLATGGKKSSRRGTTRRPDGSYESNEDTEYANPSGVDSRRLRSVRCGG